MSKIKVTRGRGNVFADIGLKDAEELLAKAKLVDRINTIIRERGLRDIDVAKTWQVELTDVHDLLRGRFQRHSFERLIGFLQALD